MAVAPKRLDLEEFLALPEEEPALEFEDGVVTQKVPPAPDHGAIQLGLGSWINTHAVPRKLARAFTETRITVDGVSRVPDVIVYRWDRVPLRESGRLAREFRVPPDITIEIVSPEQSTNSLIRKCVWYVEHGVQLALLADPSDESILAFRPGGVMAILRGDNRVDLGPILPELELVADSVFEALRHEL